MKKKLLFLFVALFAVLFLVGCEDTIAVDESHDYYVTGQFAGWGDAAGVEEFKMEAIGAKDSRVASIKDDLKDAKYIYIIEATLPAEEAGWDVTYKIDGEMVTVDGNLTVKILQINAGEEAPNWWGQNPESGEFRSLTPDTLYMPPYVEENVDDAGDWNANPVALEAGTYYVVYVQYSNTSHGLALIKK